MKTLQECKDKVAKKHGYDSFQKMEENGFGIGTGELLGYADEAAQLFAQEACKEQREICAEEYTYAAPYTMAKIELSIKNAPEPTLS
jgi:hypothetical protein